MRETIAAVLALAACLVLLVGGSWGGYLLYLRLVEGPAITQHASNVRHSLDFTQAQNQRAEDLIAQAQGADPAHAAALQHQICSAAGSLSPAERYPDVEDFYASHCS